MICNDRSVARRRTRFISVLVLLACACGNGGGEEYQDEAGFCLSPLPESCTEDTSCTREGVYGCGDVNPTSGVSVCVDGEWEFRSSCPEGCPVSGDPITGLACSAPDDTECPCLGLSSCHCQAGMLTCP